MRKNLLTAIAFFLVFDLLLLLFIFFRDSERIRHLVGIKIPAQTAPLGTEAGTAPPPRQRNRPASPSQSQQPSPTKPNAAAGEKTADQSTTPKSLALLKIQSLVAGAGTKSLVFDPEHRYVYAINLEAMTVEEFDRASRKKARTLVFDRTPATGYDYETHEKINDSYAEKPVEGCITHGGRYLWLSLHNAQGVVAWQLSGTESLPDTIPHATARIRQGKSSEATHLRFFGTGKTPKYMETSRDGRYLFVSNWHSNTVSVLDISSDSAHSWKKVKDISTGSTPRGLATSEDGRWLFVSHMGGNSVGQYDIDSLTLHQQFEIGQNPRHLLVKGPMIYATISGQQKLAKFNWQTGTLLQAVSTARQPRTICFSGDSTLIFNVCYAGQALEAFTTDSLKQIGQWESTQNPVGVVTHQQSDTIETWVCNHSNKTLKVFTFKALTIAPKDSISLSEEEVRAALKDS